MSAADPSFRPGKEYGAAAAFFHDFQSNRQKVFFLP
jgi:hypothetical protein